MITLEEAINLYLMEDRSDFTNTNYRRVLSRLLKAFGNERTLESIRYADVLKYAASLKEGVIPSTLHNYVQVIKTFFKWCADSDHILKSPCRNLKVRKPHSSTNGGKAIPPDVLVKMLNRVQKKPRNFALLLFMIDTGCRVGGISSLKLSRLDLDEGTAVLEEKGNPNAVVFFGIETANALRQWIARRPNCDHDYVFTNPRKGHQPLNRRGISKLISKLAFRVSKEHYTAHGIRHAVANAWAQKGMLATETQHKLGHASAKTTIDHYYPEAKDAVKHLSRKHSLLALGEQKVIDSMIKNRDGKIIHVEFGKRKYG